MTEQTTRDARAWADFCRGAESYVSGVASILDRRLDSKPVEIDDLLDAAGLVQIAEAFNCLHLFAEGRRDRWMAMFERQALDCVGRDGEQEIPFALLCALDALEPRDGQTVARILAHEQSASTASIDDWRSPLVASASHRTRAMLLLLKIERLHDRQAAADLHALLRSLAMSQDTTTGLWGIATPSLHQRMVATGTVLPFFRYLHRPIARTGRMADAILQAWASEPLKADPATDQAVAELLATCLSLSNHRRAELLDVMAQVVERVSCRLAEPAHRHARGRTWETWLDVATVFRLQAAGVVEASVAGSPPSRPGPGFSPPIGRLTARQREHLRQWLPSLTPPVRSAMAATPRATVVIPCFNLGAYLHDALSSALSQTLPDVEIVVVDDGSDDEFTIRALAEYESSAITVVRQANCGLAAARNTGVARARAPFVCCLDADDRLAPTFVEKSVAALEDDPSIAFVNVGMQWFDERDDAIAAHDCQIPDMLVHNRAVVGSLFRKCAWQQVGGYFGGFSVKGIEDWDFWLRLLQAGYRAGVVPELLYEYRVRAGSMSQAMYTPAHWENLMRELVARHRQLFSTQLDYVIGALSARQVETREWALARERAMLWWESKTAAWQRIARERERTIEELRAWIAELEQAKAWNDEQRQYWERIARASSDEGSHEPS
jgi:glycosyltransferase involved in cell wall biosynthesis